MSKRDQVYTRSEAQYRPLPTISPYSRVDQSRYENPKAVFRRAAKKLRETMDPDAPCSLLDMGCANGEFLYYLKKEFPNWQLQGRDIVQDFVDVARTHPGLADVDIQLGDLFDTAGQYDIVTFMGSIPIYQDLQKPLAQLLTLVRPGGVLVADGLFNANDIDVEIRFHDHSTEAGIGKWRSDFNQHSRKTVASALEDISSRHEFDEVEMDVEIPRVAGAPHINVYTFRDDDGRNVITNGANLILNGTLLTVWK